MAKMIPRYNSDIEFNNSVAEKIVYDSLNELSEDYIIFHSIEWQDKNKYNNIYFGEADFTVYIAGRGIIVIEVKGGDIYFSDSHIIQTNRFTGESYRKKPLQQANKSVYKFRDLLNQNLQYRIPVYAAVWFPDVYRSDIKGNFPVIYDDNIILTKDSFSNLNESLQNICNHYNMFIENSIEHDVATDLINLLAPEFKAIPNASLISERQEYIFLQMTKQQCYLIDYLQEVKYAIIQGMAGTGKTVLAIEKARQLNKNSEPVLFLTFNKLLADSLEKKYSQELPFVTFANIYSFVSKALNQTIDDADITRFLKTILKRGDWRYKHIIIDEGQDFSNWIAYLYELARKESGSCYVFYDKNQLIQKKDIDWINLFDCRLILTKNCRNTHSIAETACSPIHLEDMKMNTNVSKGTIPRLFIFKKDTELIKGIETILDNYLNQGIKHSDIVILTLKKLQDSFLYQHISNHPKSNLGKIISIDLVDNDKCLFTTTRKFKGLESSIVLLIDMDSTIFSTEENKRVFYVGSSRAKTFLDIFSCLTPDDEKIIVSQLSNQESSLTRFAITRDLNVNISDINAFT